MLKQVTYLLAVAAQAAASAALIPALSHGLSQAAYGQIAFVAVSQQLVTTFIGLGLPGLVTSWQSGADDAGLRRGTALPVLTLGAVLSLTALAAQSTVFLFISLLGSLNALASIVLARVAAKGLAGVWAALTIGIGPVSVGLAAAVAVTTHSLLAYLVMWTCGVACFVLASLRWSDKEWFRPTTMGKTWRRIRVSVPLSISLAAAVALTSGDRLIVSAILGEETLARYQAAYTVGNLAAVAGSALTTHWIPALMRGESAARRAQLLSVAALSIVGAIAAGPALAILLPPDYHPWTLWPIAAISALSGIPLGLYLQLQARATHRGDTRAVGLGALVVTPISMLLTGLVAKLTGSLEMIALVTPLSYTTLLAHLWRRNRLEEPASRDSRPVVVLLSSIRWAYLWQRHQSLALAATQIASVVFVESQPRRMRQLLTAPWKRLRRGSAIASTTPPIEVRLVRPSPLAVLMPRHWARVQARRIAEEAQGCPISVILYAPTTAYMELARCLAESGARVTYDAVIDWALAPPRFHPPARVADAEAAIPPSWRVVSDNPNVARDLERRLGREIAVVPPAADESFLAHAWPPLESRGEVVGWFGSVHVEMDSDLLCALSRSGIRVETVGPVEDDAVAQQLLDAGVTMRPQLPIEALPREIEHWRVTLLVYRGPRAGTITPAKLLNAVAGFRVAARGIVVPEALAAAISLLPEDDEEAIGMIKRLVAEPGAISQFPVGQLSWQGRLLQVLGTAE